MREKNEGEGNDGRSLAKLETLCHSSSCNRGLLIKFEIYVNIFQ